MMDAHHRLCLAQQLLELDDDQNDVLQQQQQRRKQRRQRRWWCRPWLLRRPAFGQFEQLMVELRVEDPVAFQTFVRFEPAMFQEMVDRLTPRISKIDTNFRKALDPGLKLAITLRYLATGDTSKSLQYGFRVAYNTICLLIPDVCQAIVEEYKDEVVKTPSTPQEWMVVANHMSNRWQYHHCLGAIDGKHIAIRKPMKAGSYYFNYKHFHSIVLMALVDGEYKFIWVDVGANGPASDAQIFEDCELKLAIDQDVIGFPPPDHLPADDKDMPYFFVGDDAFPLRTYMMKPYGRHGVDVDERIYNYRTSRCRRVSENAFGILANRFGCLLTTMKFQPEKATSIVLGAICCHNLMRMRYAGLQNGVMDREDDNNQLIPGEWRQGNTWEQHLQRIPGNRETNAGKQQ